MRSTVIVLFFCALLLLPPSVFAQEEGERSAWEPLSTGPATTWTAPIMEKGKLAVQPFVYYNRTRGSFDDDGHYSALPEGDKETLFQQYIFSQYGITDKWEIAAQMVIQQNYVTQSGVKAHHQGLGDSYLFTRYKLAEEKGWLPETTGLMQLMIPTGKYQHEDPDKLETDLMGTGSWDPGVGINLTKRLKPFMVHGDVIASFPQEVRVNGVKTQYANYLNYDAAVEYFLPRGFNLMMEVNGFAQGDQKDDGEKVPATDSSSLTFSPGIGWSNDRIQTLVAYQRTLLGTNADANDSVVVSFYYTF
jgi:hypothetical protein